MKNVLIVVDMQNDFIDMALGTAEVPLTVGPVVRLIRDEKYDTVIATMDTHGEDYMDTYEGKHLPVIHCVKDTEGWQINPKVKKALEERNALVIEKPTFGSEKLIELLKEEKPESVTFCGLCTDICVISNALMARAALNGTPMYVYKDACAGVTPEKHKAALEVMASCQIELKEEEINHE